MRQSRLFLFVACLALVLLPACGDTDSSGDGPAKGSTASTDKTLPKGGGGASLASGSGLDDALAKEVRDAMAKGRAYLLTQQTDKGGFGDKAGQIPANVSYTAMATHAIVAATSKNAVGKDEAILEGLRFVAGFQQENGSIVDNPKITNYCTGVSVSSFAAAKIAEFAKAQAAGAAYLADSQIADSLQDLSYGGFPYKQHKGQSADASNALIATNALDENGLPADSDVRKRVGVYADKVQNRSESNTSEVNVTIDGEERVVVSGVDQGGIYRPGESKAGMIKRPDGKWELRSYGSMTYAVLKLMLFAGRQADDARVKGLVRWISNNWTVERNPGFEAADDPAKAGQQGFFYYLYSMARALAAYEKTSGKPLTVTDADGRTHNWRAEIARELLSRRADDGSWRNEVAERWDEGSKTLATAFAMQTLGHVTGRLD